MGIEENRERFLAWQNRLSAYKMALTLIEIDATERPLNAGAEYRGEKAAVLSGEYMRVLKEEGIEDVMQKVASDDPDSDIRKMAELYLEKFEESRKVPEKEYSDYQRILSESERQWLICKERADYDSYWPYLEKLVDAFTAIKMYANKGQDLFDQLLDDNEKGYNRARYDELFGKVRNEVVPLLREIEKAEQPDTSFLHRYYPADKQREFNRELMKFIRFDPSWGTVSESEHPVTTGLNRNDMRFTTKYRENDLVMAALSSMHESGHAYFGHQTDPKYDGTVILENIHAGMHESQSRLVENHIGRSRTFWEVNLPKLKAVFPDELNGIGNDEFYRAINAVKPSLIRTEADEVTYPLHIMIRYEIEKGIFSGEYKIRDLEEIWNEKYREYLGVNVLNARDGILQDMHWPYAYFGYFPTYLLGSAIAAQFAHKLFEDIDVDLLLREDRYSEIMDYLGEHIHRYGGICTTDEIIEKATGTQFDPAFYTDYLKAKYMDIYNI
ncbi:MAG: carboxypeptidase M32 [Oscillospiraceae bacterium]|nr:carboxypeptidase M32 [Oscillospiraceae bacterium]